MPHRVVEEVGDGAHELDRVARHHQGADVLLGHLQGEGVGRLQTVGRQPLFDPLPGTGRWETVLLADGNVGLGGDPWRVLRRAAELISETGRCVVEFEAAGAGVRSSWVRLESSDNIGPWFRWASVGIDYAASLAREVGLAVIGIHPIGDRVVATLAPE